MIETLKSLKEALEKYNSAQETIRNANSSIKEKNLILEKMVDKNSREYEAWTNKLNSIVTKGLDKAIGAACTIAEVFGAGGVCSTIKTALVGGVKIIFGTVTRNKIAEYTEMLEKFKTITGRMVESGEDFDFTIDEAIFILSEETERINSWTSSTEFENIDKYPKEYLENYISIRTNFVKGLDDLKNSAEEYLAQPLEIL